MNKKLPSILFLAFFLVSTLSFISASNPLDGFVGQIDEGVGKVEETAERVQRISQGEARWEYLSEVWQEILLENQGVAFFNDLFERGNIVFVVLFGRDYSLSLTLIFLIILWVYFWSQFNKIIGTFSTFSSGTSLVISLGLTIILAQMQFFDWASQMIFKLLFIREGAFAWVWTIGSILFAILFAMMFSRFFSSLKITYKAHREERKRKELMGELEQKNQILGIIVDSFKTAFSLK